MNLKQWITQKLSGEKLSEILRELRWIYGYGLKYKKSILWYICLGLMGTVVSLAAGVISKNIIDAVTGYDAGGLVAAIVTYAAFQLFSVGVRALTGKVSAKIEIKVDQEIRADIYGKIMEADWEALSAFHSGDLLNRVDNDVGKVSTSVIGWVPELITCIFQFVGTFAVMMYYDATLALLALLSAPVTILVSRRLSKRMRDYHEQICQANSEAMIFQEESFQNVQMIKSFGAGSLYQEKMSQVQDKYRGIKLAYQDFAIKSNFWMSLIGMLVTGVCFGWGVYRLWTGHITYGTMTLFLQIAGMLRGSFGSLIYMVPKAISAATAAGRLMAITALPKEKYLFAQEAAELSRRNDGVAVRAQNISFHYQAGKDVLCNSDFTAEPGEIVALIGPSGGGKTTMLRILLGLVSVCEGQVEIGEKDGGLRIPVSAATRGLFSYVPQDNAMFFDTIVDNMRVVNKDATEEEIIDALKQACAYDFVASRPEGIYSKIGENGNGFSEGQIQRLAIARALLSRAPIILLDEATSALDVTTERKILRNVMEKNQNRTLIFVTHRPGVLPLCDRIYQIEQKKLRTVDREEMARIMADNGYERNS